MSNKYSPNLGEEEMKKILQEEDTGYLCMSDRNQPYGVPLSYAWIDDKIVIHCALQGKKLDIIKRNPRVCFIVSRHPDRARPHHPEGRCTYRFESVLCFGKARIIEDPKERFEYLKRFNSYFFRRLGLEEDKDTVTLKSAESCGCLVIEVETRTGRRKG